MRILDIYRELLYQTDRLTITIDNKDRNQLTEKLEALGVIDKDSEYDIEIKKHRQRRSLDANAYLWVLLDKIAQKLNSTATEVYKQAIHEVGVFTYAAVHKDKAEEFKAMWSGFGVGWFCDEEYCSIPGSVNLKCYHGSSAYDTKQMSRLIDYVVDSAKEQGIETMTPDELAQMKSTWRSE